MSKIDIGSVVAGGVIGRPTAFDLPLLLRGRGLVQASSGGGKSYFLRRMAEQAYGKVPVWIVDPEGEMSTLREKYPFYLVGKGGDTPADLRTVETVVQALRRHKASVIFDLFELRPETRHRYVRALFQALTNSPKELWTELLLLLDEAHAFAPEKGQGESEAYGEVVDIACRGRKRGISLIAFTQRLAKLSKNVTAELTNRCLGRTTEGNDVKRALDELSIPREERDLFKKDIRKLRPGEFYCVGPAISDDIVQVRVGLVETRHPEAGQAAPSAPPPPPAKLRALLAKLGDLPKEAEERARTTADLEATIRSLRAQLAARPTPPSVQLAPVTKTVTVKQEVPVLGRRQANLIERASQAANKAANELANAALKLELAVEKIGRHATVQEISAKDLPPLGRSRTRVAPYFPVPTAGSFTPAPVETKNAPIKLKDAVKAVGMAPPSKMERAILSVLSRHPEGCSKGKLTLLSGYVYSGSFQNSLSRLRAAGCIEGDNNSTMKITGMGAAHLGFCEPLPQGSDLIAYWENYPHFSKIAKSAFGVILKQPGEYTAAEAVAAAGYSYSGSFQNGMSELRTAGVIVGKNSEKLWPCKELLEAVEATA